MEQDNTPLMIVLSFFVIVAFLVGLFKQISARRQKTNSSGRNVRSIEDTSREVLKPMVSTDDNVVNAYAAFLENDSSAAAIQSVRNLPYAKEDIHIALLRQIRDCQSPVELELLRTIFITLADYQDLTDEEEQHVLEFARLSNQVSKRADNQEAIVTRIRSVAPTFARITKMVAQEGHDRMRLLGLEAG